MARNPTPILLWALVPVRVLLPGGQEEVSALIAEYNAKNPPAPVELVRRGEEYSSLKDLIASRLAGMPPDVAGIECAEAPALEGQGLAIPVPAARAARLASSRTAAATLPFQRTAPALLINLEATKRDPASFAALLEAARAARDGYEQGIAIPLLGSRGLWMLEALAGKPLWKREAGGLKANRELAPAIEALRKAIDEPGLARAEETWERALEAFLTRKTPFLVASLDAVPAVAAKAGFAWKTAPLPRFGGGRADSVSGTDLVVRRDAEEVWSFLEFLYSPEVAPRWLAAGGFLPWRAEWARSRGWKKAAARLGPSYLDVSRRLAGGRSTRSTDRDVVRARSVWIQALPGLFGEKSRRQSLDAVFTQLDLALNP